MLITFVEKMNTFISTFQASAYWYEYTEHALMGYLTFVFISKSMDKKAKHMIEHP